MQLVGFSDDALIATPIFDRVKNKYKAVMRTIVPIMIDKFTYDIINPLNSVIFPENGVAKE